METIMHEDKQEVATPAPEAPVPDVEGAGASDGAASSVSLRVVDLKSHVGLEFEMSIRSLKMAPDDARALALVLRQSANRVERLDPSTRAAIGRRRRR